MNVRLDFSKKSYSKSNRTISLYFNEVSKLEIPSAQEEYDLFKAYQENKSPGLKQQIAKGYLRFVIKQALKKTKEENLLLELISAGNEGLLIAIDKFNLDRGLRFLTYGAWWIKVYIQNALINNGIGKLPNLHKIKKTDPNFQPVQYLNDISIIPDEKDKTTINFDLFDFLEEANLNKQEKLILIYYYGLRNGIKLTFYELSLVLQDLLYVTLSPELIRLTKERSLDYLKRLFELKQINQIKDIY